jgi:DHA1 family multidrug resistance protein-like MFS transporter
MPDAAVPAPPFERTTLIGLLTIDLFARTSYGLCRTPVLPLWAASLGAGPAQVGAIGAAATLTGLVLKIPAGALSDVIGRAPLMWLGLSVFAFAPLAYPWVSVLALLFVLRVLHGCATALYSPASMAVAATVARDRRAEVLSWLSNTKIAASLAGAFLGGWLLKRASDSDGPTVAAFHDAWWIAASLGIAALIVGSFVLVRLRGSRFVPAKKGSFAQVGRGLRAAVTHRPLLLVSGVEGLQNTSVGMLEQFLPIYAVFVCGLDSFQAGVLFGVQSLSSVVCKPIFGRWSDRHGRRKPLVAGLWLCALPFFAMPLTVHFEVLLGLAFVFGLGEALVTSTASALAADVAHDAGLGAAMGAFGTIGDAGHAFGPLFCGWVLATFDDGAGDTTSSTGFRVAFWAIALAMALAAWGTTRLREPTATRE